MITLYYRKVPKPENPRTMAHRVLEQVLELTPEALQYDALGKPFLPGGPYISLSHARRAVAVAVSALPVGVDVEGLRDIRPSLPRRVFGEKEYEWYVSRGERPEDFFTLWTLKESYYKYLGTGLPGIPNGTEFVRENGIWRLTGATQRFFVFEKNQLRISVCGDAQQIAFVEVSGNAD